MGRRRVIGWPVSGASKLEQMASRGISLEIPPARRGMCGGWAGAYNSISPAIKIASAISFIGLRVFIDKR